MFADKLRLIRQKHGFASVEGAANATGITTQQWEAMERGEAVEETLGGREETLMWLRRLAETTGEHPAVLMDEAGFGEDARRERTGKR
jgi:hypothetical protein